MTENDTLPLPGEFTDRGGSTGRLMTTPCATWKRWLRSAPRGKRRTE
nr:hypothetical protein [Serratia marcescens]